MADRTNGLGLVHQEPQVPLPWRMDLTWKNTGTPPTVRLMGQGDPLTRPSRV